MPAGMRQPETQQPLGITGAGARRRLVCRPGSGHGNVDAIAIASFQGWRIGSSDRQQPGED